MLIPKFLEKTELLPEHHIESLQDITIDKDNLTTIDFIGYNARLNSKIDTIKLLAKRYPWHTSCILSHLKIIIEKYRNQLDSGKINTTYDFTSQQLINKIVSLDKSAIYPSNDDIYIETIITERNDIHLPLTSAILERNEQDIVLTLSSNDTQVIKLHAKEHLLQFIQFILSNAAGTPLSTILQSLEVPSSEDLCKVLNAQNEVIASVNETFKIIDSTLNNIIIGQIYN